MFSRHSPVEIEESAERGCSAITFDDPIRSGTMKRMTYAIVTALILGAITPGLPKLKSDVKANPVAKPAAAQIGNDACRRVSFRFRNLHNSGGRIRFQRIRYFNTVNSREQTEDVNNVECPQGATCETTNNSLRDSEGVRLTRFMLIYRFLPPGQGNNWSNEVESDWFVPNQPICRADRVYGGTQWAIR
jgi:hypothetical protein